MSAFGETGQNGVCKQRPLICSILDPSKLKEKGKTKFPKKKKNETHPAFVK